MGPRVFTRGNIHQVYIYRNPACSFNGATRLHAWKRRELDRDVAQAVALQWGHASSRVETKAKPERVNRTVKLQWGHASSRVETPLGGSGCNTSNPLQWGHASS